MVDDPASDDALAHAIEQIVAETRRRRVGAHTAGVGPAVIVARAFVVARRGDGDHRSPVGYREHADFAAA